MRISAKVWGAAVFVAVLLAIGGTVSARSAKNSRVVTALPSFRTTQPVYACPAGHGMSMKSGSCAVCQKDLQERHLLGTQGGQALFCNCATRCRCDAQGIVAGKCACDKDVSSLSAQGYYGCAKGCQYLTLKSGKCGCGATLDVLITP